MLFIVFPQNKLTFSGTSCQVTSSPPRSSLLFCWIYYLFFVSILFAFYMFYRFWQLSVYKGGHHFTWLILHSFPPTVLITLIIELSLNTSTAHVQANSCVSGQKKNIGHRNASENMNNTVKFSQSKWISLLVSTSVFCTLKISFFSTLLAYDKEFAKKS